MTFCSENNYGNLYQLNHITFNQVADWFFCFSCVANVGRDFLFVQSYNLTDMVDILWSVVADEAHRLDALQLLGQVRKNLMEPSA